MNEAETYKDWMEQLPEKISEFKRTGKADWASWTALRFMRTASKEQILRMFEDGCRPGTGETIEDLYNRSYRFSYGKKTDDYKEYDGTEVNAPNEKIAWDIFLGMSGEYNIPDARDYSVKEFMPRDIRKAFEITDDFGGWIIDSDFSRITYSITTSPGENTPCDFIELGLSPNNFDRFRGILKDGETICMKIWFNPNTNEPLITALAVEDNPGNQIEYHTEDGKKFVPYENAPEIEFSESEMKAMKKAVSEQYEKHIKRQYPERLKNVRKFTDEERKNFQGYHVTSCYVKADRYASNVEIHLDDKFYSRMNMENTKGKLEESLKTSGFKFDKDTKIWTAPMSEKTTEIAIETAELLRNVTNDDIGESLDAMTACLITYPDNMELRDDGYKWFRYADGSGGLYSSEYKNFSIGYDSTTGEAYSRDKTGKADYFMFSDGTGWDFDRVKEIGEKKAADYVLERLEEKSVTDSLGSQDVYVYEHGKYAARICHGAKEGDLAAMRTMAEALVKNINRLVPCVLIPAPNHTGKAEYTLQIAEMVKELAGNRAEVADILECEPHETLYEQKKTLVEKNGGLLTEEEKKSLDTGNIRLKSGAACVFPEEKNIYFIDNVISTGKTFGEVKALVPGIKPLIFAASKIYLENMKTMQRSENCKDAAKMLSEAIKNWRDKKSRENAFDSVKNYANKRKDVSEKSKIYDACLAKLNETLGSNELSAEWVLTGRGEGDIGEPLWAEDSVLEYIKDERNVIAMRLAFKVHGFQTMLHDYRLDAGESRPGISELEKAYKEASAAYSSISDMLSEEIKDKPIYKDFEELGDRLKKTDIKNFTLLCARKEVAYREYDDARNIADELEASVSEAKKAEEKGNVYLSEADAERREALRKTDWNVSLDLHTGSFEQLGVIENMTRSDAREEAKWKYNVPTREDIVLEDRHPEKRITARDFNPDKKQENIFPVMSETGGWTVISAGDSAESIRILYNNECLISGNESGKLKMKGWAKDYFENPGDILKAACDELGLKSDQINPTYKICYREKGGNGEIVGEVDKWNYMRKSADVGSNFRLEFTSRREAEKKMDEIKRIAEDNGQNSDELKENELFVEEIPAKFALSPAPRKTVEELKKSAIEATHGIDMKEAVKEIQSEKAQKKTAKERQFGQETELRHER